MGLGIPPLNVKSTLESTPQTSRFLVRELGVFIKEETYYTQPTIRPIMDYNRS